MASSNNNTSAEAKAMAQRYREVARYTNDAIFTLTTKGFVTTVNDAFNVITGWDKEDWIGRHFKHFITHSDFKVAGLELKRALLFEKPEFVTIRIKSKNSGNIKVEMLLVSIVEEEVTEVLGIMKRLPNGHDGDNINRSVQRLATEKGLGEKLEQFLQDLMGQLNNHKILLPVVDGLLNVNCSEILYCEASGNYTKIHTEDGKCYLVSKTLQQYELMLSSFNFFRIHNSFLVNLHAIKKYVKGDGGSVLLRNGAQLYVSKRRREAFLTRLGVKTREIAP